MKGIRFWGNIMLKLSVWCFKKVKQTNEKGCKESPYLGLAIFLCFSSKISNSITNVRSIQPVYFP